MPIEQTSSLTGQYLEKTHRPVLRSLIVPLTVAMILVVASFAAALGWMQERRLEDTVSQSIATIPKTFTKALGQAADGLAATLKALALNKDLTDALRVRDGHRLFSQWRPLFEQLRKEHGITHLYFLDSDRVCLLRVHMRERNGDRIDRFVTREAERTGRVASGIELGPLGTFTLRAVLPVFSEGILVGYVEIGKEVEDILHNLHHKPGLELAVTIQKDALSRGNWEQGMTMLGRSADWDRFPDVALIYSSTGSFPSEFDPFVAHHRHETDQTQHEMELGGKAWRLTAEKLNDASGQGVGDLIIIQDVSAQKAAFTRLISISGGILAVVVALMFSFFFLVLNRTDHGIRKREIELKESEERHRKLVESLTDGVLVRSGDIITYANPAAVKLFRAGAEADLIGKRYLDLVHPDDRAESAERIRKGLKENWIAPRREHRILALDGQVVDVESTGVPVLHGGEKHVFGVFRNITERKRADEEKDKLEAQLRQAQKLEAIGTLAGGIAHDFNNILSVIIGNSEILMMSDEATPPLREGINQILAASRRAKQLVSQILTFSRQAEQQKLLINLQPVVKETLEFLRASLPATIQLHSSIRPGAGTIIADPVQMQQILMNLCTNAAHAMEQGGGVLKIDLDNAIITQEDGRLNPEVEPGHYVRLTVSDTGHGMEPWIQERIFDPYFTTKGPGKGTGLGLSVVSGIVKSHGGMIRVYSEVGKGTTFQVFLPGADGVEETEPKAVEAMPRGTEKILLIDDETALVDLGRRMLGFLGYQVEVRTSPVEALELIRVNPKRFDAVVTDMTMPQMTGLALAREIAAIRPGIPIILCTGFSDQANEARAYSAGIRAFLFKPLVIADLAKELRKVLDEKK